MVTTTIVTQAVRAAGLTTLIALSSSAHALGLTVQLGIDAGGDTLATAYYTDGEATDVKAGQLVHIAGGLVQAVTDHAEVQFTAGYKFDSASAENGDITFDRFPLEALAFGRTEQFRAGGGLAVHLAPTLEGDGAANDVGSIEFDTAFGLVAQADWFLTDNSALGIRATLIEYQTSLADISVDGNSIGVVLTGRWE